jgi:tetratricopeptide (TPR) repeat protein
LHGYQVRRNAGVLLVQADRAERDGELRKAAEYLRRYLGVRPGETDTLARYGLLLADEQLATTPRNRVNALMVLQQVLGRDGERQAVRRRVVDLAMGLKRFTDAREHLEHLLAANPGDGELEVLLGQCHEEVGTSDHYKEAREKYESAIQHAPTQIAGSTRLASLLRLHAVEVLRAKENQAKLFQRADEAIDEMVKVNSADFRAYLARVAYRRQFPPSPDAEATRKLLEDDLERAQQLAGDNLEVLLALAGLAQDQHAPEKARNWLRQAGALYPKNPIVYQALARLEVQEGNMKTALTCLRNGLEKVPGQIDLLWDLADLLVDRNQQGEATETIERLQKLSFPQAELDYLKARLKVHDRNWLEAARLLEECSPRLFGRTERGKETLFGALAQRSDLLLAGCYERLGNPDRAYATYSRVAAQNSRSVAARQGMAALRAGMGRFEEALAEYRLLTGLPNAPASCWVAIARLELLRNLDSERPDWEAVDRALTKAERLQPLPVEVVLLRVDALAQQKMYDKAREHLVATLLRPRPMVFGVLRPEVIASALLEQARPNVEFWIGWSSLEEKQGKSAEALNLLEQAQRWSGDSVELRIARARYWGRQKGTEGLSGLAKAAEGIDRFDEEGQARLLRTLADASTGLGDLAQARKWLERLADVRKDDLGCRMVLFDLALRANDDATMGRMVDEIRQVEGEEGAWWHYGQVCRLLQRAKQAGSDKAAALSEARRHLDTVAVRRSNWSHVPFCEAQIADLEGKEDVALAKYLEAIQRGERDSLALFRAVGLLDARGRPQEAYQILRKLPRDAALASDLRRVAAEVSLRANSVAHALRLAEGAIQSDSRDYRDYLLLGRVYAAAKEVEKARPMLYKACELDEKVPEVWLALVLFLNEIGQKQQAEKEIACAERALSGEKAPLALAICYETVGQRDKADPLYLAAKAARPNDPATLRALAGYYLRTGRLKEARPHLVSLSRTKSADEAWAKRTLAVLTALEGNHREMRDAMAALGVEPDKVGKGADESSALDQRARARVLAIQQVRRDRSEAIRILENLIERKVATTEDHFLLARLYEQNGDWPRARNQLLILSTLSGGENATYLAHQARSMLRHGQPEAAAEALARLEKTAPDGVETQEINARVLHSQGKREEAVKILQGLASDKRANLAGVAGVLEELNEPEAAESMYRKLVDRSERPTDVLLLIGYLGRRKRIREALDLGERTWGKCPPEAVAEACLLVLEEAPEDRASQDRVARQFEAILAKVPKSPALLAALGHLRALQGRYDDAEAIYRQALASNDRDALAMNNLAWLLALQKRDTGEALTLVEKALDIVGANAALLDTQALVHLSRGQSEQAITILQEVTAERRTGVSYFHLAQAYQLSGNRTAATQTMRLAETAGLTRAKLHPLERPAYESLIGELKR